MLSVKAGVRPPSPAKAASPTKPKADPRIQYLSGIAKEFALAAGVDAAEKLMKLFGGERVSVPLKARPSSRIWKLGPAAAEKLVELRGGETIDVPTGAAGALRRATSMRRQQIAECFQGPEKMTINAAAKKFGVHRRTISRIRAAARQKAARIGEQRSTSGL